jgi:hypothetical protein
MRPTSAIPFFYYFCFAIYEPFLTTTGFLGAWLYVRYFFLFIYSNDTLRDPQGVSSSSYSLLTTSSIPLVTSQTHNAQAPWSANNPPPETLPKATLVTIIQLAHACALLGILNISILHAARKYLHDNPALQEKIVFSLLAPLLAGDFLHLYVTLWALGDQRWDLWAWSPMLWTTVILGLTLMVPRIAWHLGIGRYVDYRDGGRGKS